MIEPSFLLDANICIYIRQGRPNVLARFLEQTPGDSAVSVITYGELRYGVQKSRHREVSSARLHSLVAVLPVLPMPAQAGDAYGRLRARLETAGNTISSNDLWIAAHALAMGLTLVTNNEREFQRVEGLRVENWAAG